MFAPIFFVNSEKRQFVVVYEKLFEDILFLAEYNVMLRDLTNYSTWTVSIFGISICLRVNPSNKLIPYQISNQSIQK